MTTHTPIARAAAAAPALEAGQLEAEFRDYWRLLKPRVMSLVVFTAFVGLMAAPGDIHPIIALAALICIAVGAGASGALNMWWDADIDAQMGRTRTRPIPAGRVTPDEALNIGVALSALSVGLLLLFANALAAGLLAFTILFYVLVYTVWLKRRTPQNIVIGGAAGAFPPAIGWVVVTGELSIEPVLMVAIIFLWTPPHFWALALFRNEDYARVGVPMLPVVAGDRATRRQIWWYSLSMIPAALAPLATPIGGPIYAAVAILTTGKLVGLAWGLLRRTEAEAAADKHRAEKAFFGFSIIYLFALFAALLADALWRAAFA